MFPFTVDPGVEILFMFELIVWFGHVPVIEILLPGVRFGVDVPVPPCAIESGEFSDICAPVIVAPVIVALVIVGETMLLFVNVCESDVPTIVPLGADLLHALAPEPVPISS